MVSPQDGRNCAYTQLINSPRANRAQYSEISFQSIVEDDVTDVSLPSMQGLAEDKGTSSVFDLFSAATDPSSASIVLDSLSALTVQDKPTDVFTTPPQLDGELVTFTLLPRARWQTLLNLEVIQQRNKPKEPPKQPEKAPFFLPTLPGVEHRFAPDQQQHKAQVDAKATKRLQRSAGETESVFYKKLVEASESQSSDCTSHCIVDGKGGG